MTNILYQPHKNHQESVAPTRDECARVPSPEGELVGFYEDLQKILSIITVTFIVSYHIFSLPL